MLFKKLLKLLSGVTAGLFLFLNSSHAAMANVVKDNTISSISSKVSEFDVKREDTEDTEDTESMEITENTTEEEFIKLIGEEVTLSISGQVRLTKKVIEAIETKIKEGSYLQLLVTDGGILILGDDSTSLNGSYNNNSGLTILRLKEEGALLRIDTTKPVTITGVTFQNDDINEPVVDVGTNTQASFTSNKFFNGLLDLTGVESGIDININSLIYGQDYVKLSAKVESAIKFNDLKINFQASNISRSNLRSYVAETTKFGDKVFESSEVKIVGLRPGNSHFLDIELQDTDSKGNTYSIYYLPVIEDIIYTSQFNNFNLERLKLESDSVTFDVFLGTNGSDKNGRKQYPLTLEVKDNSGNFKETITVEGKEAERKSYTINKLSPNTTYTCTLIDGLGNEISRETFTTISSSSSTGESGSSSLNNNTILSITSYDINKSDISDVDISIPISNETLLNSFKTGKDFSVNLKGVKISFDGSKIKLEGLVPNKEYKNLTITYTDNKDVKQTVNVNNFATKRPFTALKEFILQVYNSSMNRDADEEGFTYWNKKLEDKSIAPQSFVLNLLAEDEFKEIYKTIEGRIEGLYKVIVNREADKEGLEFWTNRYKDVLSQENDESSALLKIANEMVNEKEFVERCKQLFEQDFDGSQK